MSDHFKKLYPYKKYSSITNGFDEDDFSATGGLVPNKEKFVITYTGIFNKEQNPQKFFEAIFQVITNRKDFEKYLKLKIIGQLDNPGDFENTNFFKKLGLDKYSEQIQYLPHRQAIEEMCRSSVLLLLVGIYQHNEGILTGKIFEYLRSGRPILAVVPPNGLAAEVIKSTNSGLVVSNERVEDISQGIQNLFDMFLANKLENSFKRIGIEKYSRENLTNELSEVFIKTIGQKDNPLKKSDIVK
jgi:glycosyltransferase involved in cell wall biosynthesis